MKSSSLWMCASCECMCTCTMYNVCNLFSCTCTLSSQMVISSGDNCTQDGWSPLVITSEKGHLDIVMY